MIWGIGIQYLISDFWRRVRRELSELALFSRCVVLKSVEEWEYKYVWNMQGRPQTLQYKVRVWGCRKCKCSAVGLLLNVSVIF
jgi:hypothetical protein